MELEPGGAAGQLDDEVGELAELTAAERAELEALLTASPEDQEYAEETREFCQLLQGSIGGNTAPATLTDAQKQAIAKTIIVTINIQQVDKPITVRIF